MCSWGLSEWGDIANIVIAVASVVTAIVTARMLIKQHKLDKEKLLVQQQEHQPIFKFDDSHKDFLSIRNDGYSLSAPAHITINSLIVIQVAKYIEKNEWHPLYLTCFRFDRYRNVQLTNNYQGDLAQCNKQINTIQNLFSLRVQHLKDALNKWQQSLQLIIPGNVDHAVVMADLVKIEYKDMYKIRRISYFWNNYEISQNLYDELLTVADHITPNPIDLGGTSITSMMDVVCKFKYKKKIAYDRKETIYIKGTLKG